LPRKTGALLQHNYLHSYRVGGCQISQAGLSQWLELFSKDQKPSSKTKERKGKERKGKERKGKERRRKEVKKLLGTLVFLTQLKLKNESTHCTAR